MKTKKNRRILQALLICLLLVFTILPPITASAADAGYFFVDDAGLLTDEQGAALESQLSEISDKHNMDFVIFTEENADISSPMEAADDFFDYNGYGVGEDYSGTILYINLATRDCWISARGDGITFFTDAGMDYIIEQITGSLSDGDYEYAFDDYVSLCDDFATQAETGSPYDVDNMPTEPFPFFGNLLISLVVGLVAAVIYILVLRGQLKSVAPNESAADYMVPGSLHLTKEREFFLYNTVQRTARADNDSSGGSDTHVSSSGATHSGRGGTF